MNKNTLYSIVIIVCFIIVGISYYLVELNKQESIERQKKLEIEQKNRELDFEISKQEKIDKENIDKQSNLEFCLENAEEAYISYAKLNGEVKEDGTVFATTRVWDNANNNKKIATDLCFSKYK